MSIHEKAVEKWTKSRAGYFRTTCPPSCGGYFSGLPCPVHWKTDLSSYKRELTPLLKHTILGDKMSFKM